LRTNFLFKKTFNYVLRITGDLPRLTFGLEASLYAARELRGHKDVPALRHPSFGKKDARITYSFRGTVVAKFESLSDVANPVLLTVTAWLSSVVHSGDRWLVVPVGPARVWLDRYWLGICKVRSFAHLLSSVANGIEKRTRFLEPLLIRSSTFFILPMTFN
jgi:hypothetical protein